MEFLHESSPDESSLEFLHQSSLDEKFGHSFLDKSDLYGFLVGRMAADRPRTFKLHHHGTESKFE